MINPTPNYLSDLGPADGPLMARDGRSICGVLDPASDERIGEAHPLGSVETSRGRLALYRIVIGGVESPGRFVLVCREWVPVEVWLLFRQPGNP